MVENILLTVQNYFYCIILNIFLLTLFTASMDYYQIFSITIIDHFDVNTILDDRSNQISITTEYFLVPKRHKSIF